MEAATNFEVSRKRVETGFGARSGQGRAHDYLDVADAVDKNAGCASVQWQSMRLL